MKPLPIDPPVLWKTVSAFPEDPPEVAGCPEELEVI